MPVSPHWSGWARWRRYGRCRRPLAVPVPRPLVSVLGRLGVRLHVGRLDARHRAQGLGGSLLVTGGRPDVPGGEFRVTGARVRRRHLYAERCRRRPRLGCGSRVRRELDRDRQPETTRPTTVAPSYQTRTVLPEPRKARCTASNWPPVGPSSTRQAESTKNQSRAGPAGIGISSAQYCVAIPPTTAATASARATPALAFTASVGEVETVPAPATAARGDALGMVVTDISLLPLESGEFLGSGTVDHEAGHEV